MLLCLLMTAPGAVFGETEDTPAVYVDYDGDGFDDNAADADGDGIPDPPDKAEKTAPAGTLVFNIGDAGEIDVDGFLVNSEKFGARCFLSRDLSDNRCGFDIGDSFGGEEGAVGNISGGVTCEGGVCH